MFDQFARTKLIVFCCGRSTFLFDPAVMYFISRYNSHSLYELYSAGKIPAVSYFSFKFTNITRKSSERFAVGVNFKYRTIVRGSDLKNAFLLLAGIFRTNNNFDSSFNIILTSTLHAV